VTDTTIKRILIFFAAVLIFYLMNSLASILLPLVLALLTALIVQPLIIFLSKKGLPKWLILPTFAILSLSILFGIGLIISDTASQLVDQEQFFVSRFLMKTDEALIWINSTFNLNWDTTFLVSELYKSIQSGWLNSFIANIASEIGSFISSFLFFALYYVMLLAGMSHYKSYISYVGGDKSESYLHEYENIQQQVFSYMWVKTLINVGTGLLTFIFCIIFGIKFAIFWAFLAFIFSFVPNIGSILSTILPILMAVIQLDSIESLLFFAILLVAMHFVMGNIVEPIIMGNRLRLNTLTVLFGLVFWGYIWGIPGMILSVPLLVIMKLILERFPEVSIISRVMGYPDNK
jgi:predicted PurR-regulated permease PerM